MVFQRNPKGYWFEDFDAEETKDSENVTQTAYTSDFSAR